MRAILGHVLSLTLLLLTSACTVGSNIISPAYYPTTTAEIIGNVEVRQFEYTPKYSLYGQNDLPRTGRSLSETVNSYFTNALRRELIQAKSTVTPKSQCRMSGKIIDISTELGAFGSGHYKSTIRYNLKLDNGRPVYSNIFDVAYTGSNDLRENISKVFSDNIKQLLNDPDFQVAFNEWCGATAKNTPATVQDNSQATTQVVAPSKRASKK